jgi:hypothetical protein
MLLLWYAVRSSASSTLDCFHAGQKTQAKLWKAWLLALLRHLAPMATSLRPVFAGAKSNSLFPALLQRKAAH